MDSGSVTLPSRSKVNRPGRAGFQRRLLRREPVRFADRITRAETSPTPAGGIKMAIVSRRVLFGRPDHIMNPVRLT